MVRLDTHQFLQEISYYHTGTVVSVVLVVCDTFGLNFYLTIQCRIVFFNSKTQHRGAPSFHGVHTFSSGPTKTCLYLARLDVLVQEDGSL